ncbi:MAG: alkaline phosphatase PhoX, partial [Bacteroidota bacterium]
DPVTAEVMDYDNDGNNDKLWGLGNLAHENVSEPVGDSIIYFGEDNSPGREDNYVYKYIMDTPGNLYSGRLFVLVLDDETNPALGGDWVELPNSTVEEHNNVVVAARAEGAWNLPRVEDVEIGPHDGKVYITSTAFDQIYRLDDMGDRAENIEIYLDNIDYQVDSMGIKTQSVNFNSPDNLCFDNEGNLFIMQDGGEGYIFFASKDHTPANPDLKIFASFPDGSEPTGMTMTPDNKFLFVSVQHPFESNSEAQKDATGAEIVYDRATTVVMSLQEDLPTGRVQMQNVPESFDVLKTYPNPVQDELNLVVNSQVPQRVTVEITNNVGYTLRKAEVQLNAGENTMELDVSELATQLYYVTIRAEDGNLSTKFIKLAR